MSCSFLLIPTKFPTLNIHYKDVNSTALLGFSSFSCLRVRRRSGSIATSISRGRSPGCKCQLADIAPVTSAAYGVILLGGGLFAFSKSGSKGSLFGGLTGAALMGAVLYMVKEGLGRRTEEWVLLL
ncbi:PROTEIN FATTY ACID EXPORT 4 CHLOROPLASTIC [Salix koriyanagi]|uniref:PROTEIN FATTY ACID EXPORT 4 CHLOROPLASTIC n=1 Tax=Salix koriyanagi TaxID=2511006 RepID=A0A9Q0X2H1_9ROSI|nr:PROTEIN FATTY ACID EXPORT 4 CHLOROPLASTIC [Salix koriyanagi]